MLITTKRAWPWWAEVLLVVGFGVPTLQEAYIGAAARPVSVQVALAVVASLSVALRYRLPLVALVCTVVAAAALGTILPLLVVLFHLVSHGRTAAALTAAAVALAANALAPESNSLWGMRSYGVLMPLAIVLAFGLWAANRRRLVAALAGQVDQLRVERELRAEQARLHERARIAAEMHDVLAHRLSVVALHTGALQRRAASLPGPVADRLALLRTASTQALGDLRDVLGALRETNGPQDGGGFGGSRTPGLRELPALLDEAREAGQSIDAVIEGDAGSLPASHRLAVHRLVQESLTNARKHAAGAPVRVEVRFGPPQTTVRISNVAGRPSPDVAAGGGYGLVGLSERVGALGGRLAYGPAGAGGWRIEAGIPLTHHLTPAATASRTPDATGTAGGPDAVSAPTAPSPSDPPPGEA
ncbi:histidine kinase [Streptomyces sp. MST-110588]|uniref:sensor histidine kinase n=1 Tax=Streptomyces sp. MST-110588 TaxID=2833628 RepID=UPI001F5E22D0|nr:histidine kinase [Streptomyces sp. MST-110588]UNO41658.1 two-component sensor histidine kinase [Streptomyces sp. MST-110588]